jgi:Mn2+/Fe2+ NRAMP family transporter
MELFLIFFPFLHLVALIAGGIVLLIVKRKYPKVRNSELIIVFILFFILVAIFTEPGLDLIKRLISLIQVE